MKDKKFIDILPKFNNWEDIKYTASLNCPHCEKSGFVGDIERPNLIGWCETPQGYMIVFECPHCFEKFRFHGNCDDLYDVEKFDWYLGVNYVEMSANKDEILAKWEKYWKE